MKDGNDRLKNNSGGMHVLTKHDIKHNIRSGKNYNKNITGTMSKFDNLNIDNYQLLLIDIEGLEYDFFLGAQKSIIKNKPIIITEIWDNKKRAMENMKISKEKVIQLILSMGYQIYKKMLDDYVFIPLNKYKTISQGYL